MDIVIASDLKKYYGYGDTTVKALDGISLSIKKGEFVSIIGSSGSGKSTLLHMLGGLDTPTSGEVIVNGRKLQNMNKDEQTIFRRRNIGFVFQNYNLLPLLNVYENIVLPIQLDKQKIDKEYVDTVIEALGIHSKIHTMPNHLSGGQQQRVAMARALVTKPAIILADEPTGNLDSKTGQDVLDLIQMSSKKFGQTIIMITHDNGIAELAERKIRLEDGKIYGDKL